jgi:hypothetical protein
MRRKGTPHRSLTPQKGDALESIDVHDLPEGDAQLIAQLVEPLRRRVHGSEAEGADIPEATAEIESSASLNRYPQRFLTRQEER